MTATRWKLTTITKDDTQAGGENADPWKSRGCSFWSKYIIKTLERRQWASRFIIVLLVITAVSLSTTNGRRQIKISWHQRKKMRFYSENTAKATAYKAIIIQADFFTEKSLFNIKEEPWSRSYVDVKVLVILFRNCVDCFRHSYRNKCLIDSQKPTSSSC